MKDKPNIILVHGAWVDGSSWSKVIALLLDNGFNVSSVQLPLTSLDEDIAVTRNVLSMQQGPTILVGQSYGGAVITGAGYNAKNVTGLVYITAFALDEGETTQEVDNREGTPAGAAQIRPDDSGLLWIARDGYAKAFASDVDPLEVKIMAVTQKPIAVKAFISKSGPPAWKQVPSWYLISTKDEMIPPAVQEFMAKRSGATIRSIPASHASIVSQPQEVADIIILAAESTAT